MSFALDEVVHAGGVGRNLANDRTLRAALNHQFALSCRPNPDEFFRRDEWRHLQVYRSILNNASPYNRNTYQALSFIDYILCKTLKKRVGDTALRTAALIVRGLEGCLFMGY